MIDSLTRTPGPTVTPKPIDTFGPSFIEGLLDISHNNKLRFNYHTTAVGSTVAEG